jgi:hypothetical protein
MYKRNKNTIILDLNFIKNKGFTFNIKELYNVKMERFTGKLLEINKNKKMILNNEDQFSLYNINLYEIFKMIEIEKYWNDFEKKNETLNISTDFSNNHNVI